MAFPRPVKAVVFDMDGLLVDTEAVYCDALFAEATAMGREIPRTLLHRILGQQWAVVADLLRETFGEDFDTEALRAGAADRFNTLIEAEVALKAGVVELLDQLDQLRLPRAIATSARREVVNHHLGPLTQRFDVIIARGDYDRPKPDPQPFLKAAEALGASPADCLALEDAYHGIRSAAAAGMMTVMVPDILDATEEMETLCVRIVRDLHEVRDLLTEQAA